MRLLPWEYAVRNLGRHPLRLVLSLAGSALVVLLVLAAAAFVRGMEKSLSVAGSGKNVVLLGAGSEESLERSEIQPSVGSILAASVDGIKEKLGVHYISPEVHMASLVKETSDSDVTHLTLLRGVTHAAFLVHTQIRITEGRAPGLGEILAGRLASAKMGLPDERLAVGKTLWFDGRLWTISGRFEAPGTVMEAELWCPLKDLQLAAKRDNLSCVVATLDKAEFADVAAFTKQRLDLELSAMWESEYYGKILQFYRPVQSIVWITAMLIAIGGLFGGLNTMYAAFAARVRELGTLQALGFSRMAVILSLMQESVLASATGALLASVLGLLILDGLAVRFSMGAFGLVMDGPVLAAGLGAGLLLGVLGALPPAFRCLKLPVAESLKAT
ncbi:MAG TPA: ABC transporter permease [Planctomycetota bacterium]|nr:ABC transporter permease [Planctomycetota bacterium]